MSDWIGWGLTAYIGCVAFPSVMYGWWRIDGLLSRCDNLEELAAIKALVNQPLMTVLWPFPWVKAIKRLATKEAEGPKE